MLVCVRGDFRGDLAELSWVVALATVLDNSASCS